MELEIRRVALQAAVQSHGVTVLTDADGVERPDESVIVRAAAVYAGFLDPPDVAAPATIRDTLWELGRLITEHPDPWGMLRTSIEETTIRQVIDEAPETPEMDAAFLDAALAIAAKLRSIANWAQIHHEEPF